MSDLGGSSDSTNVISYQKNKNSYYKKVTTKCLYAIKNIDGDDYNNRCCAQYDCTRHEKDRLTQNKITSGHQVPICSYFSYIFLAISSYCSYFLALLHLTCISCISFPGFLYRFSFFFSVAH